MSHLAPPQTPRASPPHPPDHRFSVAGSAGDTHQKPDLRSARSSWPETVREYTEKKQVEEMQKCKNEGSQWGGKRGVVQNGKRTDRVSVMCL